MTLAEIILIGLGLSMDAAAVSIANGLTYRNLKKSQKSPQIWACRRTRSINTADSKERSGI